MTKLYYTILDLVAISLVVYIGVDVFYRIVSSELKEISTKEVVVEQVPNVEVKKKIPLSDFSLITERNLFGSLEKASEGVKEEEVEDLEPTSLRIALLGTVTGDEQNAFAVIEEKDKGKQGLYRVGDSIQNATVKMILREKVVLRVGEKDEILTMEESAASRREKGQGLSQPSKKEGSTITVNRKELSDSLKDINKVLSQVRIRVCAKIRQKGPRQRRQKYLGPLRQDQRADLHLRPLGAGLPRNGPGRIPRHHKRILSRRRHLYVDGQEP